MCVCVLVWPVVARCRPCAPSVPAVAAGTLVVRIDSKCERVRRSDGHFLRQIFTIDCALSHTTNTRAAHEKCSPGRHTTSRTRHNDHKRCTDVGKGRPRAQAIAGGHWPSPCPRPSRSCFSERRQRGGCFDQPGRRARTSRVDSVELSTQPSSDVENAPSEAHFRAAQGGDARRASRAT